ncbi:ECF transporter S component [Fusibacter bizertensis]|uniref:Riboflavin transporter n=1 Tax=Fusibacter bizertensis TaxID=1488331 RepID=A0ABT6NEY6_9FIRM|nr:ECF transporter S component [Fusibacter bizertensis]MDH8678956.1 ECF transporter S component [Fusibacter bizertensis]
MVTSTKKLSVSKMTKIAMLSVLAFVIMQLELMIPIFPSFLKLDMSDLPALIGAFAMGPMAGVAIEAVKNILHLLQTSTGGVGELANFAIGSAIVIPSAIIYAKNKSKKSAIIGLLVGTLFMAIVGALANYFVLIPFYTAFMPIDTIVELGTIVNPSINSVATLVLFGIVPFNLFKGLVLSALTLVLYKRISPVLHKGL